MIAAPGLHERLRLAAGVRERPPRRAVADAPGNLLAGGRWEDTAAGPALYVERVYDADATHGDFSLSELCEVPGEALSVLGAVADPQRLLFIDLETTGLNGGTGTLAFLVGVARFDGRRLRLRQYFLPRPHEEGALLEGIAAFARGVSQVVSYNGSSFDLPLLETRHTMMRSPFWPEGLGHLDLLHSTRRFYNRALDSCRLADVEFSVLGVRRGSDIAGWTVPAAYHQFVNEGTVGLMPAVFRHNALDVLSLVTLLRRLGGLVAGERVSFPSEALELARLAATHGDMGAARRYMDVARRSAVDARSQHLVFWRTLALLKRGSCWPELRDHCLEGLRAGWREPAVYVEAAKACEHRTRELELALKLVDRALLRAGMLTGRAGLVSDLELRRARILRKLGGAGKGAKRTGPSGDGPASGAPVIGLPLPAHSLAKRVLADNPAIDPRR
ncbi:MAG: hypothetical protein GEU28_04715 [Dehalococcoidia bacterium]|nr:hypothetical protein [Dehalococcoidia bacterium]